MVSGRVVFSNFVCVGYSCRLRVEIVRVSGGFLFEVGVLVYLVFEFLFLDLVFREG